MYDAEALKDIIAELKEKIIESLDLVDISPDDIDENARLVGGDLGIDSIDVLELVMMIEENYSVKIDNKELGAKVFTTLATLARFIVDNRPEKSN